MSADWIRLRSYQPEIREGREKTPEVVLNERQRSAIKSGAKVLAEYLCQEIPTKVGRKLTSREIRERHRQDVRLNGRR